MLRHNQQSYPNLHSIPKSSAHKNTNQAQGFQFPEDHEDALYNIWESYKKSVYVKVPFSISEQRNKAVFLMMQCHRIMKLPLQTLFLAASVFDKVLNTNYQLTELKFKEDININTLGIACLYSCQKLQKIRNYGVSHWLKHLSNDNLAAIGYPRISLTSESLKKYEAFIMQTMNYNLFSSTIFDLLLGIWTLKPPNQKQFYFGQYLIQLSLFCQLGNQKQQNHNTSTAQSFSTNQIAQSSPQIRIKDGSNILLIDIAIAISNLSSYFFGKQKYSGQALIKKIWKQYYQNSSHITNKQLQSKKNIIKNISNELFEKVRSCENDKNCRRVIEKYKKQTNFAISTYRFLDREQMHTSTQDKKQQNKVNQSNQRYSEMRRNVSAQKQQKNRMIINNIEGIGNLSGLSYNAITSSSTIFSGRDYGSSNYINNNSNVQIKPDSARQLGFRSF